MQRIIDGHSFEEISEGIFNKPDIKLSVNGASNLALFNIRGLSNKNILFTHHHYESMERMDDVLSEV